MKIAKEHIIILIIILVIMLLGVTYGYFFLLVSSEEDSTELYTGTLIANFEQGETIYEQAFYPRSEPTLTDLKNAYFSKFSVSNTGTLDGIMQINLYVTENGFQYGDLRYALYNPAGMKIITGPVPAGEKATLLNNVLLKSQQSAQYTLVIWLQETGLQQNKNEDKRLTAAIALDLIQYVEEEKE